jgi:hypothetical protein
LLIKRRLQRERRIVLEYTIAAANLHNLGTRADGHLNVGVARIQGKEEQKSIAVNVENINASLHIVT